MKLLKRAFLFIFLIVSWQIAVYFGWINSLILPSPLSIASSFIQLSTSGELVLDILSSIKRVGVGFLIAVFLGVPLGVISAYSKNVSWFLTPLFEFLRPIPPIAWIPIAILWFGLGDAPAYFIVFVGAFFPIFINSYWGIRSGKFTYFNVAKNIGANRFLIFTDVLLPGSLPHIMSGLRIGMGLAWTSVISAELVGAQSGLGYMIQLNRIMLRTNKIVVGMIAIGIVGFIMNYLMMLLERRLTFWNQDTIGMVLHKRK